MNPYSTLTLISLCVSVLGAETNSPDPTTDRVGFPRDYAKSYAVLRTVSREDGKKLVTVYGNREAASITNKLQLPYPNNSILVMETASTVKDSTGAVQKGEVRGLHVMRRGKDFGIDYAAKRSGEWEFAEYKADGSYITPPQKSATCAECHIKAGPDKDFVYKARFADAEKK